MSQPPGNRPPTRRVSTGRPQPPEPPQQSYSSQRTQRTQRAQPAARPSRNVNAPRRSDPFPIVLGAIIGAMVIGLMVVVYLISSNNGTGTGTTNGNNGTAS